MRKRLIKSERGAALLETAITLPIILLVSVAIFEFGRAYQTWQVLTNAAREGARLAVTPASNAANVQALVRTYMQNGGLPNYATADVQVVSEDLVSGSASTITIGYPFSFMVLQPVIQLIHAGSATGEPITMGATATMRNESP
jgi:Flp pilus assembly protein TadG